VDLAENPLTKGVISSEQAMRGYKAAMDAALGRSSQALTEWIEGLRQRFARPLPSPASCRMLSPRPLVGFGWRQAFAAPCGRSASMSAFGAAAWSLASAARSGSRRGAWGCLSPFDDVTDCRCHRGELVGGESLFERRMLWVIYFSGPIPISPDDRITLFLQAVR